jgi:transmembrane sensor
VSHAEREAADWFARMRRPDAKQHRAAFEAWRSNPENAAAYAHAEEDWLIAGGIARAHVEAKAPSIVFAPGRLGWAMAMMAAVAISLAVAWQVVGNRSRPQVAANSYAPSEIRLPDGTGVMLKEGARIETRFTSNERRVILFGGRARFAVAHDAARPFIVAAGPSETIALGTVFEIDLQSPDRPRIALIEGSVEVRSRDGSHRLRLKAGQTARLLPEGVKIMTGPAELLQATWVEVDGVRLEEVIDRANGANAVPIRLADPALAGMRVTGRFDLRDSPALARKLAAALDLDVETGDDGPILKAK